MKMPLLRFGRIILTVVLTCSLVLGPIGSTALACNVPVFRYALEHWRPDPYRAVLFHRGQLSPAEQERLADLQVRADNSLVNLALRAVDLDATPEPADRELFATLGDAPLPRLVIQYPAHLHVEAPVWSGSFGDQELTALFDSPLRREILRRLTSGQTAVWLMIDCGDAAQDDPAAKTLDNEIKKLQSTLKLPELTDSPEDVIQDGPPLRVEFSMLRVRRDDPAEQALVAMLVHCEPDLPTLNEPLVFPLFGRSRSMLPLVGAGISEENIRSSARFLAGACSCQVKELNPGFDLLLTADWKELLSWAKSPAFATGESPMSETTEPELVPIPSGSSTTSSDNASSRPADVTAEEPTPVAATPATVENGSPTPAQEGPSMMLIIGGLAIVLLIGVTFVARSRA